MGLSLGPVRTTASGIWRLDAGGVSIAKLSPTTRRPWVAGTRFPTSTVLRQIMIELTGRVEHQMGEQGRRRRAEEGIFLFVKSGDRNDLPNMRVGRDCTGRIDEKWLTDIEVEPVVEHPHLGRAGFQASLTVIPPVRRDTAEPDSTGSWLDTSPG